MLKVGIDIGTSYSSIAILDKDSKALPIKVANGSSVYGDNYSMPSAVYVNEDASLDIGQLAMSSRIKNPSRFKGEFKRDLGGNIPYQLGALQLMPEDLYKEIFIHFKKSAEEFSGEKVSKGYITYPATYSKKKIELLRKTAKRSGFLDIELIDEPTAAAYCYCAKRNVKENDKLLIYDFGGGTFDIAFIEYTKEGFKPITRALGLDRCGGVDVDRIIFEDIYSKIPNNTIEMINNSPVGRNRFNAQILELSIRIKHQLTYKDVCKEGIPVGFEYIDYELSRERFNILIKPLVDETIEQVKLIVKNGGLCIEDITTCVLVGGTSRIPYVKDRLEELIGNRVYRDIDPELAACMGASLWDTQNKKTNTSETHQKALDYYYGTNGTQQDYKKAFHYFTISAEEDISDAQFHLGKCYFNGHGVDINNKEAIKWLKKAGEKGHVRGQYALGYFYREGKIVKKDMKEAVKWYEMGAEQGHDDSLNELGWIYFKGMGTEKNNSKAIKYYKKAVKLGNSYAQNNLGYCYMNGIGVEQSYSRALELYKLSAKQDHPEAHYNIGVMYQEGNGVTKDVYEGFKWIKKSANLGYSEAQYELGICYAVGRGVELSYETAIEWFTKSANQGYVVAQCELGECYEEGRGVGKYEKEAFKWYKKAADQDYAKAQYCVGKCYKEGKGVELNTQEALKWYKKADKQNYSKGAKAIGDHYYFFEHDVDEAVKWYTRASEIGNWSADYMLEKIRTPWYKKIF